MKNLSYLLKFGFYCSMIFLLAGLLKINVSGIDFNVLGMYILLLSPLGFVFFLVVFFAYQKNIKNSAIAFVLLVVLLINILL